MKYQGTYGTNLSSGSLYFRRYTLWNIGVLTSPGTSLKKVFRVKPS
jgi:hypothetical protein